MEPVNPSPLNQEAPNGSPVDSSSTPSPATEVPFPSGQPSSGRKPSWLLPAIGLALIGGGIGLWRFFSPPLASSPPATATQGPPPRAVEITTLTVGSGARQIQLLGQVVASQQATIRTQTDGVVEQVLVNPGDRVAAGQTIAILDQADQVLTVAQARARLAQERSNLARLEVGTRPEIIAQRRAAVQSAQAREREAQDNLQRTQGLVKEGAISQRLLVEARTAVDDARGDRLAAEAALAEAVAGPIQEEIEAQQANVAAAQAQLNQAQLAMQRTRITAPTTAIVQSREVSAGDFIEIADPVVTLVAGDRLEVYLELPEELSGQVGPGSAVSLAARALPQWQGRATITGVVPVAEAGSRRQRARVQLNNPPRGLLPGMSILGRLELPTNRPGFLISRDALTRRQGQWLVFTIVNNKAQPVPVQMLADMGEQVTIASPDLKAGETIVLRGGDGLNEGAPVKVVKP